MIFEWDEKKNELNFIKHKLNFVCVEDFPWHEAIIFDRTHIEDSEKRYAAVGKLYGKLHTVIFTKRGKSTRVISLRRANKSEEKAYENKIKKS